MVGFEAGNLLTIFERPAPAQTPLSRLDLVHMGGEVLYSAEYELSTPPQRGERGETARRPRGSRR